MPFLTSASYTVISVNLTTEYSDPPDNSQPLTNIYRVLVNFPSNNSYLVASDGVLIEAVGPGSTGILTVTNTQITHSGTIRTSWLGVDMEGQGGLYVGPNAVIDSAKAVRLRADGGKVINDGTIMASLVGVEGWDSILATNNGSISGVAGIVVYGTANQPNTGSRITNNGIISAFDTGIELADVNSVVLNSGTVTAGQIGIRVTAAFAADGVYTITNIGMVTARTAVQGSAFRDSLTNDGFLDGLVELGGGDDLYLGIRGTATGVIRLDGDGDPEPANDPVGNDTAYGGLGNETIDAGHGDNLIDGGGGDDLILAGAGDDTLRGGTGQDTIQAGEGDNRLDGGDGDDVFSAESGDDSFIGGDGEDTVEFFGGNVTVDLRLVTAQASGFGLDRFLGIENVTSGSGDDHLTGSASDNVLRAGAGRDTLEGGAGNDLLEGGGGTDTARYAGPAAAVVSLALQGAPQDTGGHGGDTLTGIANLEGGAGDDVFTGDDGVNVLHGGGGNDTLAGGKGNDMLNGGEGTDAAVFSGASANYQIVRGPEGAVMITDLRAGQDGVDTLTDIRFAKFSDATLALFNEAPLAPALSHASIAENIPASAVVGWLSTTDPDGDAVTYSLVGNPDGAFAIGGDLLVLARPLDYETKSRHTISIRAADAHGGETVRSFTVAVVDVPEHLVLRGTSAANRLTGGSGNDTVFGGAGADVLTGGAGRDTFVFDTRSNTRTNRDAIIDFNVADDRILLDNKYFSKLGSGSLAKPGALKADFLRIGEKAREANDYLIYNRTTGVLSYDEDGSGAKAAVQIAKLTNKVSLTKSDFFIV